MKLTPRELEKLQMHCIGKLAEERKARGVKLNYVETIGYLCAQLHELARDGKTVGTKMLTRADVMEGVPEMIHDVQIEATFPDGTKLVTVHNPVQ